METEKIMLFRKKLRQLQIKLDELLKLDGSCCGVSLSQCYTLLEIGNKKQLSMKELASEMGLDTSTLSRTIDGLVNIGLVDRVQNSDDRRYVTITLTKQGESIYNSIQEYYNIYFMSLFKLMPEEKHQQVIESFILFSDALQRGQPDQFKLQNKKQE